MDAHCLLADEQGGGDLGVRAVRDQLAQHLRLPRGEPGERGRSLRPAWDVAARPGRCEPSPPVPRPALQGHGSLLSWRTGGPIAAGPRPPPRDWPARDERGGQPPRRALPFPPHPCGRAGGIASRQSPAWSALPSARPRSAAYSAAVAGWRVSRSPRRWNGTPGSSARRSPAGPASPGGVVRRPRRGLSRARSTRSPIARAPQTISSSRARRSTALTGRTRSTTASAPPGSPQASCSSARRGPAIISGRSSSDGMISRARARWPRAASSEPRCARPGRRPTTGSPTSYGGCRSSQVRRAAPAAHR